MAVNQDYTDGDLGLSPGANLPDDEGLALVATLARRQVELEDALIAHEAEGKALRADLQLIAERDLPAAMAGVGLSQFRLTDGTVISEKLVYRCGQLDDSEDDPKKPDRKPLSERLKAFEWFREEGHSDLVKTNVTILTGRGLESFVDDLMAWLRDHPKANQVAVKRARTVLWNTLSAFVKAEDEALREPPLDLLGVSKIHVAKVTRAKPEVEL